MNVLNDQIQWQTHEYAITAFEYPVFSAINDHELLIFSFSPFRKNQVMAMKFDTQTNSASLIDEFSTDKSTDR